MAIVKERDICKLATEMVNEYIKKGYILSPTMSGHQGEVLKVDLSNGKDIVRIMTNRKSKNYYTQTYVVTVKLYENAKIYDSMSILWNDDGKEVANVVFYEIKRNYGKESIFCDSKSEYDSIMAKRDKRFCHENSTFTFDLSNERVMNIALSYMKKQYKCKSIKKNDIISFSKCISNDRVIYKIYAKNKIYILK